MHGHVLAAPHDYVRKSGGSHFVYAHVLNGRGIVERSVPGAEVNSEQTHIHTYTYRGIFRKNATLYWHSTRDTRRCKCRLCCCCLDMGYYVPVPSGIGARSVGFSQLAQ